MFWIGWRRGGVKLKTTREIFGSQPERFGSPLFNQSIDRPHKTDNHIHKHNRYKTDQKNMNEPNYRTG